MTYTVSLLYWLSAGLYDVLTLITTGSTITLHPALLLLVDSSTVLFSRQVCWLLLRWPDSFHQLSKDLLSRCPRISFHQLSKGLLSRSYYDSADSAESNSHLEPTLDTYVQPQDSVEGLSLAHTPHSAESQQKKVVESGTPQTAPGLRRRLQLSLAHFTRHRDSAEGCSWVWLHTQHRDSAEGYSWVWLHTQHRDSTEGCSWVWLTTVHATRTPGLHLEQERVWNW